MRLRKQDATGDYQFGHNAADFWVNQVEGVAQSVETRLLLFRGEWFLDATEGTPWGGFPLNPRVVSEGQILASHTQLTRDVAIQQRVLSTPGVQNVSGYSSTGDPNLRNFAAQMTVNTIYGQFQMTINQVAAAPGFTLTYSGLGGSDPL